MGPQNNSLFGRYLDYMGIGLNFMWNAPAAALVALGPNASEMDVGPWISGWFAMNACLTGPLVALAVWATVKVGPLLCVHDLCT